MATGPKGKPKKPTKKQQLEKQYKQQRQRIEKYIAQRERQGFTFQENLVPPKPKNITEASVRRLKNLSARELLKKSTYATPTGEKKSGVSGAREIAQRKRQETVERKQQERQRAYEDWARFIDEVDYSDDVDEILANIEDIINNWQPDPNWTPSLAKLKEQDKNQCQNILNGAIGTFGREVIARRLQDEAESGTDITALVNSICYDSGDSYRHGGREAAQSKLKLWREILWKQRMSVDEAQEFSRDYEQPWPDEPE